MNNLPPEEQERLVRAVFRMSSDGARPASIGRELGRSREWARKVLLGKIWPRVAPDLERFAGGIPNQTCRNCRLRADRPGDEVACSLGYPEAEMQANWARQCPAYTPES